MIAEEVLVEAIMDTRSQIDFIWQFFVTVHIAVFALLFIYDEAVESMNIVAKILAAAGIALFEWLNGLGLVKAYLLLDSLMEQYRALYGKKDRFVASFYEHFVQASFKDGPDTIYVTHGMAFLVVILALISRSFIQRRKARTSAGPQA
jgi:ammonia channel protein AmtB